MSIESGYYHSCGTKYILFWQIQDGTLFQVKACPVCRLYRFLHTNEVELTEDMQKVFQENFLNILA